MITERAPLRRIVTGHDAHGRSIIDLDSDAPHSWSSDTVPGFGASVAWSTPAGPIDNAVPRDAASADADIPTFPPPGGTILRVADFPPDEAYPVKAASVVFDEIDGEEARQKPADGQAPRHFWFHRTDSLDYAVVLDGEIVLMLDEGETLLKAGDVVIQRATNHAWSNRSGRNCRMLFALLGSEPATPAQLGAVRAEATRP